MTYIPRFANAEVVRHCSTCDTLNKGTRYFRLQDKDLPVISNKDPMIILTSSYLSQNCVPETYKPHIKEIMEKEPKECPKEPIITLTEFYNLIGLSLPQRVFMVTDDKKLAVAVEEALGFHRIIVNPVCVSQYGGLLDRGATLDNVLSMVGNPGDIGRYDALVLDGQLTKGGHANEGLNIAEKAMKSGVDGGRIIIHSKRIEELRKKAVSLPGVELFSKPTDGDYSYLLAALAKRAPESAHLIV
ncbi:MAG TPA: hypothetical protein VJI46_02845 [Candidatus Nanoarchaeia archaeon]|nr:hypothetical protein [Candidatus Nanoarchaeia archaeon]